MAKRDIHGFLTIEPQPGDVVQTEVQAGNISFKELARLRAIAQWNNNTTYNKTIHIYPWKNAFLLDDNDPNVAHARVDAAYVTTYPNTHTGGGNLASDDWARLRQSATLGTVAAATTPRVIGAVGLFDARSLAVPANLGLASGNNLLALNDVPLEYTQIGHQVYPHPAHRDAQTVATSVGLSYVTYTDNQFWDFHTSGASTMGFWYLRIESGADAGVYFIEHKNYSNNRLYLRHLDGTMFSAAATASGLLVTTGPGRRAYFNETSIIALSVGSVSTSGRYAPRGAGMLGDPALRGSFIVRVCVDKSGSTEAATGTEQQGSYYFTLKEFTHGDGAQGSDNDYGDFISLGFNDNSATSTELLSNVQFWAGGCGALLLDWKNQRLWGACTDASDNSSLLHWRWKTAEGTREIANYLGTALHGNLLTPAPTLASGDRVLGGGVGTDSTVYFAISHASGGGTGLLCIYENLTTAKFTTVDGFPAASKLAAAVVDKSRNRTGTASDASTNGADQVTSASGAFTDSDIGRAIKLTGLGADSGTYKIATRVSGTEVTVTTLAGAGVTFTSQSGGTFEIGDRIYLLFNDASTGAGVINYMESLAQGTFHTRSVSMTNGAQCTIRPATATSSPQHATIDPDGNLYWISNDTQIQVNKYTVATNAHSRRTIADIQSPSGGSPSNPGTPTVLNAIHANSKFDELWVGSDAGHFKLIRSDFTGSSYKRYYGTDTATYVNPTGFLRTAGARADVSNSMNVRWYLEAPDGRMISMIRGSSGNTDFLLYARHLDVWAPKGFLASVVGTFAHAAVTDPYGCIYVIGPRTQVSGASTWPSRQFIIGKIEVDYQWDNANSRWVPLEWTPGGVPNKSVSDTTAPYAKARPIHSTAEELCFGAKIQWTRQGGATPPNNEFLGRAGLVRATNTDGATTSGVGTFTGSGFVAGDVGNYLRIESGADAGIYKVSAYTSPTQVTLTRVSNAAFSASATAGTLTYTVWSVGSIGANAGPESYTFMLADGFGKDNTQDITGLSYEGHTLKTRLYEWDEAVKCTVPSPIAVLGATETKVYFEAYARATPQYEAAVSNHRALPGAETSGARTLMDFCIQHQLNGSGGFPSINSSPSNSNIWSGIVANTGVLGYSTMVDFGTNVEVGYILLRVRCGAASANLAATNTNSGLIGNIYRAEGAAPVASSTTRFSGTSTLNGATNATTLTLSSGDFLGPITTGPNTDGAIVAEASTFTATGGTFVAGDRGKILKITAGAGSDNGSYRIVSVAGGGASVTIRNLDQTAKAWTASATGVTYEVRDGVQEDDMLASPSLGTPTHKLAVERLLSTTSVQIRTGPNTTLTNQSFAVVAPTWTKVKRISFNTEAEPPDVKDNKTFVTPNGRDNGSNQQDFIVYADFTDLAAGDRTGRYWKWSAQPRFAGAGGPGVHDLCTWEFYSPSGERLALSNYQILDEARTNADFLASNMGRIDFIQAKSTGVGEAGYNGNAVLAANTGQVTLAGGNTFLGFKLGVTRTDGVVTSGVNTLDSASSAFPLSAVVGRVVRFLSGTHSGELYRVASRPSATQLTLVTLSGGAVVWGATESSISFNVHEGINVGGTTPDRIYFETAGAEYSLAAISNDGKTLTLAALGERALSSQPWTIRRPGFRTASATTEGSKAARLVQNTIPVQSGDCYDDYKGCYTFFSEDIGPGYQRTNGTVPGGTDIFAGEQFSPDDVGRLLYITTGVNVGIYEIYFYVASDVIAVKNHYTGAAVTLTADAGPVTYQVIGDRRFQWAKHVIVLRQ
jgi:hypothetical protein